MQPHQVMNSINKISNFIILILIGIVVGVNCHAQSFLTNGLIAYYPFNGNVNDASGNGYSGYLNGPTYGTNRFGATNSALKFNGIKNTFVVTKLPLLNESFSYSAWIRIAGPNSYDLESFGANQFWNFSFAYNENQFALYDNVNKFPGFAAMLEPLPQSITGFGVQSLMITRILSKYIIMAH